MDCLEKILVADPTLAARLFIENHDLLSRQFPFEDYKAKLVETIARISRCPAELPPELDYSRSPENFSRLEALQRVNQQLPEEPSGGNAGKNPSEVETDPSLNQLKTLLSGSKLNPEMVDTIIKHGFSPGGSYKPFGAHRSQEANLRRRIAHTLDHKFNPRAYQDALN
jgi:hypothetical protein